MDELVSLMYDISTLIPDQTYRQIMDLLTTIKDKEKEFEYPPEISIVIDDIEELIKQKRKIGFVAAPNKKYMKVTINAFSKRNLNEIIEHYDQKVDLFRQILSLKNEIQILRKCIDHLNDSVALKKEIDRLRLELEKARTKINTLTAMNKKARFNR